MIEHPIQFLFTSSVSTTEPLTDQSAAKLRAADHVERYHESGWACITGFDKDQRVTVMVHANSDDAINRALGLVRNDNPYEMFRGRGHGYA